MKRIVYILLFAMALLPSALHANDHGDFESVFAQDDKDEVTISVYPNPAQDRVNVLAPKDSEIMFYDLVGQKVDVTTLSEIDKQSGTSYTFDLQNLPKGLYFIKVKNIEQKSHQLIKIKKL